MEDTFRFENSDTAYGAPLARPQDMAENAQAAATFLKAIAHEKRLMILCHLKTGEKSVTELERLVSARQAAVSQQLARLRIQGLVTFRREGKTIYYTLADDKARRMIALLYDLFCEDDDRASATR